MKKVTLLRRESEFCTKVTNYTRFVKSKQKLKKEKKMHVAKREEKPALFVIIGGS